MLIQKYTKQNGVTVQTHLRMTPADKRKRVYIIISVGLMVMITHLWFKSLEVPLKTLTAYPIAKVEDTLQVIWLLDAEVTNYSELDSCHTGKSCLMANGKKAHIGALACPRNLRLGTRVIIDNTPYVCEDRVSLKYPNRFDIFAGYGKASYLKALKYGKQVKEIAIYEK